MIFTLTAYSDITAGLNTTELSFFEYCILVSNPCCPMPAKDSKASLNKAKCIAVRGWVFCSLLAPECPCPNSVLCCTPTSCSHLFLPFSPGPRTLTKMSHHSFQMAWGHCAPRCSLSCLCPLPLHGLTAELQFKPHSQLKLFCFFSSK